MMATAQRQRGGGFGFAGGARGPSSQLQSEDHFTYDPEDGVLPLTQCAL